MARRIGSTRISIINERHPMPDENPGFDCHPFTNERMAADLAVSADLGAFLDFDERSDSGLVSNLATIKINKAVNADVLPELYIGCYSAKL